MLFNIGRAAIAPIKSACEETAAFSSDQKLTLSRSWYKETDCTLDGTNCRFVRSGPRSGTALVRSLLATPSARPTEHRSSTIPSRKLADQPAFLTSPPKVSAKIRAPVIASGDESLR